MEETRFNIIGVGEILWDIYENEKYLGGAPANFAYHCQQLGDRGIIASRVGDDDLGRSVIDILRQRGLETGYIQQDSSRKTGTVHVTIDRAGKPQFQCSTDVAFDYLEADDRFRSLAQEADAILFGTLAQRNSVSRESIHCFLSSASHAFKIYDINLRGWDDSIELIVEKSLAYADAIKLNDDELGILKQAWLPGLDDISFLQFMLDKFDLKLAALTLGEDGCMLVQKEEVVRDKGIKIKPKDTTGSGDAFAAALVHHILRNKSLEEIAAKSNLLGAFIALFPGATPGYSLADLKKFQQDFVPDFF
ncbi:MAG TPA: carbohydrate kinase [bacterium]